LVQGPSRLSGSAPGSERRHLHPHRLLERQGSKMEEREPRPLRWLGTLCMADCGDCPHPVAAFMGTNRALDLRRRHPCRARDRARIETLRWARNARGRRPGGYYPRPAPASTWTAPLVARPLPTKIHSPYPPAILLFGIPKATRGRPRTLYRRSGKSPRVGTHLNTWAP